MLTLSNIFTQSLSGIAGGGTEVFATIGELPLSNNETGRQAYVVQNNRLYIWNGTGWFNIALINTNPTITQGPDSSYVFATDGTPTVITLVAEDPEGIPITWSSQVTSGTLGNTATISQNGNVFTITPSTDEADIGTFSVTFTASDGVNIATAVSSFTLAFFTADLFYNQSVVLTTSSVNNGNNNVFVDSSTNNFAITRNGNTTQGTFSPYSPAGWSGYFDGTTDYLQISNNTALTLAGGDYTLEAWIYPQKASNFQLIVGKRGSTGGSREYQLWISDTNLLSCSSSSGSNYSSTQVVEQNKWSHVAVTVVGGTESSTARLFYNGNLVATFTSFNNSVVQSSSITIGSLTDGQGFGGYMSDVRIVKGTALYTENFTLQFSPLTAVAGTSLLTLQDNRFIDRSTNNFTVTRNGDTRITPFSPFRPSVEYSPSVHGGSGYFDGTGDYLVLGSDVNNFAGDVTVECWIYPEAVGTGARQWLFSTADNGAGSWAINISSGSGTLEIWLGGYSFVARTSTIPVIPMAWNHIALVRLNGTISLYINGVSAMATATSQWGRGSIIGIGLYYDALAQFFKGYMSGFRYITGTAMYTGNFILPTEPSSPTIDTYRQLNFTNSNIFDETGKVVVETVGDAKTSTAVVKYGTTSMAFDGTGDYLLVPNSPLINFGSENFTIECWVRTTSITLSEQTIAALYGYTSDRRSWHVYITNDKLAIRYATSGANATVTQSDVSSFITNTWYHVAYVRDGSTFKGYVNGINVVTASPSTAALFNNTVDPMSIGAVGPSYTGFFNGHISDLRITKGRARYTANFTPPTQKLGYNNAE
jgi:hypothetical protein